MTIATNSEDEAFIFRKRKNNTKNMVKLTDAWLTKEDKNNVKIKLRASKKDSDFARCFLCCCDLKNSTQGFQTFTQHSARPKHKQILDITFGNNKTQRAFHQSLQGASICCRNSAVF